MQVFIAYILTAGIFLKILRSLFESKTLFFKTSSSNSFQMETNQTNVERTLVVGRDMRQNTDLYLKVVLCFAWVMSVWISVRTALILHKMPVRPLMWIGPTQTVQHFVDFAVSKYFPQKYILVCTQYIESLISWLEISVFNTFFTKHK